MSLNIYMGRNGVLFLEDFISGSAFLDYVLILPNQVKRTHIYNKTMFDYCVIGYDVYNTS